MEKRAFPVMTLELDKMPQDIPEKKAAGVRRRRKKEEERKE